MAGQRLTESERELTQKTTIQLERELKKLTARARVIAKEIIRRKSPCQ